jgi:AcrR family transcriptional regulator
MSLVATETGIGRATLYKYFSDVDAILFAWHERQVTGHLDQLAEIRDHTDGADARLEAVLTTYALISHERHGTELATMLHQGDHVDRAHQHLHALVRDLLAEGVRAGDVRADVPPDELAGFCLHALTAAGNLAGEDAVRRLVQVTLAGLRPSTH